MIDRTVSPPVQRELTDEEIDQLVNADLSHLYPSDIAHSVHSMIVGMHRAGVVDDQTLEQFDIICMEANNEARDRETAEKAELPKLSPSGLSPGRGDP